MRDGNYRLLHWLGSHEVTVLLAVAGIAAGVWIFAALAGEVGEGDTQVFDRTVLLALRQPGTLAPLGPPAVQDAARDITALGGVAVLALVTMIAAGFLILDGKGNMAMFLCGSVVSGLIVGTMLKGILFPVRASPADIP
jgi:undecaprenyl-diphosphatase